MLHDLAITLGMPLYKMKSDMPYDELKNWLVYLERRPLGWREDMRTYILLRGLGVKQKPEEIFESLKSVFKEQQRSFKNTAMFQKLLGAQGGDRLEILFDEAQN